MVVHLCLVAVEGDEGDLVPAGVRLRQQPHRSALRHASRLLQTVTEPAKPSLPFRCPQLDTAVASQLRSYIAQRSFAHEHLLPLTSGLGGYV